MLAATLASPRANGLRPVDLGRDLGAIADLIELCFQDQMDSGGRATIRDMRTLSQLGPLLPLLTNTDSLLRGIRGGLVWQEDGRIVGNVTVFPADYPRQWAHELGRTMVIANVAVHPHYRRRGIARAMMQAALAQIDQQGGRAILQVEHYNDGARALYEQLGFVVQRTWQHWRRSASQPPPARPAHALPALAALTLRPAQRWQEEYALAARIFPPEGGGLGWQRPLHPREFRRSLWRQVADALSGVHLERWMVAGPDGALLGALWVEGGFARATYRLTLLVHPDQQGQLEAPLLADVLRRQDGYHSYWCEHPAGDAAASAALAQCGFSVRRSLTHMCRERVRRYAVGL